MLGIVWKKPCGLKTVVLSQLVLKYIYGNQNTGANQTQKCVKIVVNFIVTSSEVVKLLEPTVLSGILYAEVGKQDLV